MAQVLRMRLFAISDACAVALQLCFDLLLRRNKHKIINREIIFEKFIRKPVSLDLNAICISLPARR